MTPSTVVEFFGDFRKEYWRKSLKSSIKLINQSGRPIVSLDVPSGLDSLSGQASGACVKACTTIAFGFSKTGLIKNDGISYAGKIISPLI